MRHAWLFASQWVSPSDEEIENGDFDSTKHQEKVSKLRTKAMKDIWAECEFEGVTGLLSHNSDPHTVGTSLGQTICAVRKRADFLGQCLSITGDLEGQIDGCIQGFLTSIGNKPLDTILPAIAEGMDPDGIARLFRCAPFGQ